MHRHHTCMPSTAKSLYSPYPEFQIGRNGILHKNDSIARGNGMAQLLHGKRVRGCPSPNPIRCYTIVPSRTQESPSLAELEPTRATPALPYPQNRLAGCEASTPQPGRNLHIQTWPARAHRSTPARGSLPSRALPPLAECGRCLLLLLPLPLLPCPTLCRKGRVFCC